MSQESKPPTKRTHLGRAMTGAITPNSLHLQQCQQCKTVQYPPREVCVSCLSDDLPWREVDPAGTVQASSQLHHCLEPYFSARKPWLMGSVKLDCGPVVLAHIDPQVCDAGCRVWVLSVADASEEAVLTAIAQSIELDQASETGRTLIMKEPVETS
ncbi:MAG: Zn-ribbon domain-containing OB-fold protein [Halioglobus sp.]